MDKILKIEEIKNAKISDPRFWGHSKYDGYLVETENHKYRILIENGQGCCESWGYFSTVDDHNDFIGANLIDIELTDESLNTKKLKESGYYDEEGIQFVSFKTDRGVFQLAVYNYHNGYYGHTIVIDKDEVIMLDDVL